MKKQNNIAVREAAEKQHLYLWEVATIMGISYSGFMQKIRTEWSDEEQQRVIKLIEEYARREEEHNG